MRRLSLLTGTPQPAPSRPAAPEPPPDPMAQVLESLDYLKLEPAERAKREAEPLIAAERAAFAQRLAESGRAHDEALAAERSARAAAEAEAAALRAQTEQALRAQEEALFTLREALAAAESEAARLSAALAAKTEEADLARRQAAKPPTTTPPPPAPAAAALKPADIQLEYHRHDNGLLRQVVLRARGYMDTVIAIERGPDHRMRNLKVME